MAEGAAEVSAASDGGGDLGTVELNGEWRPSNLSESVRKAPEQRCRELGQRPAGSSPALPGLSARRASEHLEITHVGNRHMRAKGHHGACWSGRPK